MLKICYLRDLCFIPKEKFLKKANKPLYLSRRPVNTTYLKSKHPDYNQNNIDGDTGTADVEPNDAEFTQGSVSQYQLQWLLKINVLQMR